MNKLITILLLLGCCFCYGDRRRAQYSQQATAGGGGGSTPDLLHWPLDDAPGTDIAADVGPDGTTDGTLNSDYLALTTASAQSDSTINYGGSVATFAFWIYVTDWNAGAENVILEDSANYGNPNAFTIGFQGNSVTAILYNGGDRTENFSTTTESLANDTWYHFGVVYDNSTVAGNIKIYVNGTERTLTVLGNNKTGSGNLRTDFLHLGARNAAGSFFAGRLDDLRIYSGEKDATFIDALYDAGRP